MNFKLESNGGSRLYLYFLVAALLTALSTGAFPFIGQALGCLTLAWLACGVFCWWAKI